MEEKEFEPEVLDDTFPYRVAYYYKYKYDLNPFISEFNIFFTKSSTVKRLVRFCRLYKDRKINISFRDDFDRDISAQICSMFDNVRIRLAPEDSKQVDFLRKNDIPFFFDYTYPASTYNQLSSLLDLGVCAIYLADDLVYNMEDVHELCSSRGVEIRCVLNRIPTTAVGVSYKDVIYSPRDIDDIAQYYDVFEFAGLDELVEKSYHKFNVLFKAFFVDKCWHGQLAEINEDIPFSYHQDFVADEIERYKHNCTRRCDSRASSKCQRCRRIINDQQKVLMEKGFYIAPT